MSALFFYDLVYLFVMLFSTTANSDSISCEYYIDILKNQLYFLKIVENL